MKLGKIFSGDVCALLALLTVPVSAQLDCTKVVIENKRFDFGKLRGPHSVLTSEHDATANTLTNTTYTLDLCGTLKRKDDSTKVCPVGTRVCGITRFIDDKGTDTISHVIPIAGALENYGGKHFEWNAERLSTSDAPGDESKEGVRLSLTGGNYEGVPQRAVIELRCAQNLTGTEGEIDPEDKYTLTPEESRLAVRDDAPAGEPPSGGVGWKERQVLNEGAALIWNSYEESSDRREKILSLTWHTKYACEVIEEEPEQSKHWGLFTWLVILIFLATASYLIFGSWLNYNRYGARGWDLLPHGDAIRDIPYLLKDWTRRFLNTVQSSGSRGGYSAV